MRHRLSYLGCLYFKLKLFQRNKFQVEKIIQQSNCRSMTTTLVKVQSYNKVCYTISNLKVIIPLQYKRASCRRAHHRNLSTIAVLFLLHAFAADSWTTTTYQWIHRARLWYEARCCVL